MFDAEEWDQVFEEELEELKLDPELASLIRTLISKTWVRYWARVNYGLPQSDP